ncbi:2'-5' RNA ligase family protein [Paenisporosarcina sp. TG-14]|uniref:2'-5' RNA ligase family protein n=1 Tax=Paenisporosarcina sp. TG-14 TaxID=1231057 RepID=UPI000305B297|nr:2'-5' RNA ligase family protein [Paenisporosarcina sp. TG-14]
MRFFIGIVPSDEYKKRLLDFHHKWKNNRITDVVEPHITLKAQGGLTTDEKWLSKVKEVCNNFNSFQITLEKPMFFGEDILYLSATSNELYKLHKSIVRVISPSNDLIKKFFELDDFVPHMTLGKINYGLSNKELREMGNLAEKELIPFPTFEVRFVRVYQEIEPNKYRKFLDIPLNNIIPTT